MKYRISEIPVINAEPVFRIEVAYKYDAGVFRKVMLERWVCSNSIGNPVVTRAGRPSMDDSLKPFKTLNKAKAYLRSILEYRKAETKVVFEVQETEQSDLKKL